MYNNQQTFMVFLQYTPPVGCFDDHCVKLRDRCYEPCPTCPDVCHNTTEEERDACQEGHHYYFYSPVMEYRINCMGLTKSFSIAESQYLGVSLGPILAGYLADKFGRRLMLLGLLSFGIPFLVLSAAINHVSAVYIFRFLLGVTIGGTQSVGWTFCAEMISPKHRFKLRTFTSWTNGRILMSLFAFLGHTSWRLASYYNAAACLCTFAIIAFLPESVLWLRRKEKYKREKAAVEFLEWIRGMEQKSEKEKKKVQAPQMSLLEVFQNPDLCKSFLVLCVMWFCAGICMFSLDLNSEDMTHNLWVGQFSAAALSSIIRVMFGFADHKFLWLGRRLVYILSMGTCVIASAALLYENIYDMKGTTLYFITYLISFNAISLSWEPCYLCAAELMPTEVRAKTTSLLNVLANGLSNALAARIVATFKGNWEPGILIIVLVADIFSFIVTSLFLKETKNIKLDAIGVVKDVEKGSTEKLSSEEVGKTPGADLSKTPLTSKASAEVVAGSKEGASKDEGASDDKKSSISKAPAESLSKAPVTSKASAEGVTGSKEDAKDDSRGVSEEKKAIGSAEKLEFEKEKKSDEPRLASKEGTKFNKLSPEPSKPVEENIGEAKGAREESKDSKEEVKGSKEEQKESDEKEDEPEKGSKEKVSDDVGSLGENEAQEK